LTRLSTTDEEPVLFPKRSRADGVFHEVVVQLDPAVLEINFQRRPLA
jgi:hypothetical protein